MRTSKGGNEKNHMLLDSFQDSSFFSPSFLSAFSPIHYSIDSQHNIYFSNAIPVNLPKDLLYQ